jgi:ADP-heptose:LPS heptosyltransferase
VYSIRKSRPGAEITLICQAAFADVPMLYPAPPDDVLPLNFNPYTVATVDDQLLDRLRRMTTAIPPRKQPLTFISAEFRCTWLSPVVAALSRAEVAVSASPPAGQNYLVKRISEELGLEVRTLQQAALEEGMAETDRYLRLAEMVNAQPETMPRWRLPQDVEAEARATLGSLRLDPGGYLACSPLAASRLPALRRWAPARFQEVIRRAQQRYGVSVLVAGERREQQELNEFAASVDNCRVFTGAPGELPRLAGLIANARCFLSNDSGPAHLAQAYGVPTVALFGGGAGWPAYRCWAPGAIAVLNQLPCYGCDWDCLFDTALCLDAIHVEDAWNALRQTFESPPTSAATAPVQNVPGSFFPWLESAARRRKELRSELDRRQEVVLELSSEAQRRLELIEDLDRRLKSKESKDFLIAHQS